MNPWVNRLLNLWIAFILIAAALLSPWVLFSKVMMLFHLKEAAAYGFRAPYLDHLSRGGGGHAHTYWYPWPQAPETAVIATSLPDGLQTLPTEELKFWINASDPRQFTQEAVPADNKDWVMVRPKGIRSSPEESEANARALADANARARRASAPLSSTGDPLKNPLRPDLGNSQPNEPTDDAPPPPLPYTHTYVYAHPLPSNATWLEGSDTLPEGESMVVHRCWVNAYKPAESFLRKPGLSGLVLPLLGMLLLTLPGVYYLAMKTTAYLSQRKMAGKVQRKRG